MIEIKIVVVALISFLWWLGGGKNAWARDTIIPIIIGLFVFLNHPTTILWKDALIGILTIGVCNIIRLGYGNYSPEDDDKPSFLASSIHDRGGWWIRGIYGLICGIVSWIPQLVVDFSQITLFKAIAYVIGFSFICFFVVRFRLSRLPTDLAIGASFGIRIFI